MNIGIIGLGRMGMSIASRLLKQGHHVFGFNHSDRALTEAQAMGVTVVPTLIELAAAVDIFWIMVPAGNPVDEVLEQLILHVKKDAIIIDGGNSKYTDSIRRAELLLNKNIYFLDCGTSGGLQGRELGFCLMVGGNKKAYDIITPLLAAIAMPDGYSYIGPSGSGHYVKMIHNGIEYALLQAYAEGFHLLKDGSYKNLDLANIAHLWNHGSIIRSWILQLLAEILDKDQSLSTISGKVEESGMGRWTVEEAKKNNIPVTLIEDALKIRVQSDLHGTYATKLVAMLRNAFGGHKVFEKE